MLSILLLGPPQIWLDEQPLAITRRKSRALLYYVAAHPEPVTRDHLLTFFWPDYERATGQQILRTTLHGLRKTLGPTLLAEDDTVALAGETRVDARNLVAAVSQPRPDPDRLAAALTEYRGDFLADFTLPDTPAFDDWGFAERERYRRLAARGWTVVARWHESGQNYPAALDALTQALALDPLQEDLQREAMRLQYLAGDRPGAIRRYDHLRKLLDEELGVLPMAETRAVYDAIITGSLPVPKPEAQRVLGDLIAPSSRSMPRLPEPPSPALLPFTGRTAELETLHSLAFSHKLLLIEGEAGIGKTRLADEFLRAIPALVLRSTAYELEQTLPYQPLIEALRGLITAPEWPALRSGLGLPDLWLAETARLVPELATPLPGSAGSSFAAPLAARTTDESRLWEGIRQFLLALARQQPVVLFLDDLHWADRSTLALLGYLVRQSATAPIVFLAGARPADLRSPLIGLLHALGRDNRLTRLPLSRLTADEVTLLARHFSSGYTYPLADWLLRYSEGNPYILAELLSHAQQNHWLSASGVLNLQAISTGPVVPPTVYSPIQARLARLSDSAHRVLDVAVAIGREFEFEVVMRAAGLSEVAVLDVLDELQSAGLVHPLDDVRYVFDHTLTMEVAYREVGELRHRLLHRRVAEALESIHRQNVDTVAGLLASHFSEGRAPGRAAPYALRAGQLAVGLAAWSEAIAFYQQALLGIEDAQRGAVFMALGEAYFYAGTLTQSSEAFRAALEVARARSDQAAANQARLALARSFLSQARFKEIVALVQETLATGDPESTVMAEFIWGTALSIEGADLAGAAEHLRRAAALCAARPDPVVLAQINFESGSVAAQQGDLPRAVALYRAVLDLTRNLKTDPGVQWQILADNNLAYHLHLLGDPAAEDYAQAGLDLAREKGILPLQPYLLSTLGEIALARGDLSLAETYFQDGLALAERLSVPERVAGLTANLGLVARQRGDSALALQRLSAALAQADELGTQHLAAQIRLWLVPLLPPAEARTYLAEARAIAEAGGRQRLLAEADRLAVKETRRQGDKGTDPSVP